MLGKSHRENPPTGSQSLQRNHGVIDIQLSTCRPMTKSGCVFVSLSLDKSKWHKVRGLGGDRMINTYHISRQIYKSSRDQNWPVLGWTALIISSLKCIKNKNSQHLQSIHASTNCEY
ncbi:hypothetical protein ATANTOWER_002292 [Ataeniobius toweri]|uniref:Uncharacterized protein n=1 Tax=Ataeniobius toweri TaxID=208326 RepID=A0ABU7AAD4_9TELE|nr:hypothetical protein [Ataeniobius toweri]